jgi:hypothetical protein
MTLTYKKLKIKYAKFPRVTYSTSRPEEKLAVFIFKEGDFAGVIFYKFGNMHGQCKLRK